MEPEAGESPEEETREGSETEAAPRGRRTNRRRSAKNANNTKAPMDGAGCGCGGGKAKKCTCDGGCGGYAKKMDRNDALTPQEYLAACDLGIQGRSRQYIRARLDAAGRLDKKCGASGIADNKKCQIESGGALAQKGTSALGNALKIAAVGAGVGLAAKAAHTMYQSRKREVPIFNIKRKGKTILTVGKATMSGAPGHNTVAGAFNAARKEAQRSRRSKPRGFGRTDTPYALGFALDTAALGV